MPVWPQSSLTYEHKFHSMGDGPNLALLWGMVGAYELHQIRIADGAQRPHIVHHLVPLLLQQTEA